jgi:hypothetical protein
MRALSFVAVLMLGGCATTGRDFDIARVDQLQPGISTVSDAVALLGPYSTEAVTNGAHSYAWSFAHATAFSAAHAKMVVLAFGPDGKLLSRTTSATGP